MLHNVPAGSRLLVRAWRDGDVLQLHARPTPHPITLTLILTLTLTLIPKPNP